MRLSMLAVVGAAVALSACAATPAPEAAPARTGLDAAGVYDFSTSVDGTVVSGTIRITRGGDGRYGGVITTTALEDAAISEVTVDGNRIDITSYTGEGPAELTLDMRGAQFTGTWRYAGMSGTLNGRRRD